MSAFQDLASTAPKVESAKAERACETESLRVDPAKPSEDVRVEPAARVGAAVTYDDPKEFAPPMTKAEASHLSVAALRGSGPGFESKVSFELRCC
jgi:hypothetical protein